MNENILKHYEMKLLWKNKRIMERNGKIKDVYVQPERSKREDWECDFCEGQCKCLLRQKNPPRCGALNTMET